MSTGTFINFYLPYKKEGAFVSDREQAEAILEKANDLIANGASGVAITYSANYGQTRDIEQVYFKGGWDTHTGGANQASVMSRMESLLGSEYQALQGKTRIVPITTMNAYDDPVAPWNDDVHLGIVTTDLDRIRIYLEAGWHVLGWQNQDTVDRDEKPYAIGGGVASIPGAVAAKIQHTLIGYAEKYRA